VREVLAKLAGGNRRSIGRSEEVVSDIMRDPTLFEAVFGGMLSEDPLIRMRSADAVEKFTASHPEYLQAHKETLIGQVASVEQQEVRWHVAQMLPRLELNTDERAAAFSIFCSATSTTGARSSRPSPCRPSPTLHKMMSPYGLRRSSCSRI
jgi:hypothetical protein